MERQDRLIEEFLKPGEMAFYSSLYFSESDRAWVKESYANVYPSYGECLRQTLADDEDDVVKIKMTKKYIEDNHSIELTLFSRRQSD